MRDPGTGAAEADLTIVLSYVASEAIGEKWRQAIVDLGDAVRAGLEARGACVVWVNSARPSESAVVSVERADGVVVLGGVDIDPALYGQAVEIDNLWFATPEGDEHEIGLVRSAAAERKPVFGICRGSQLINVAFGGTLIQDLGAGIHVKEVMGEDADASDPWTEHAVRIADGTTLGSLLGVPRLDARVGHHQAVDRVGDGLRAAATAEDGVVEAVESVDSDSWVLGVQWHPEEASADPEVLDRLLDGFVSAAREAAARR